VFSGDVLFQGSIGRTDLPGGDTATLMRTLGELVDALPDETTVYPGHMGVTTIGRERETNPFLRELTRSR
jgi:hydroxyacylglutathione hydrolase